MTYYERHLPHWIPEGRPLFITWRLHRSLPVAVLYRLRQKYGKDAGKLFLYADRELDRAGSGPKWLKEPRIARCVVQSLKKGQELGHYKLWSFAVMANHVHILIEPNVPMAHITKSIKGPTARAANQILNRRALPFWQDESFDHWVRNQRQFERILHYIEHNPVSAGLVAKPCDWPWSSAWSGASATSMNNDPGGG